MITATKTDGGALEFKDDAADLSDQDRVLIQAAIKSGFTEFTIPGEGQQRQVWMTRKWMAVRDGKPVCFLVAHISNNPHFEVIGPDLPLDPSVRTVRLNSESESKSAAK